MCCATYFNLDLRTTCVPTRVVKSPISNTIEVHFHESNMDCRTTATENMIFSQHYGQCGQEVTYDFRFQADETTHILKKQKNKSIANVSLGNTSFLSHFVEWMKFLFLPQGYPNSVSNDYIYYQFWDTIQAFCSYLSGTLTTRAIMQGVGVGDAAATPLAATITWIMRDGTGMVGRIIFASWKGPALDSNCKQWRLAADILNDIAMAIELSSPIIPEQFFMYALCLATSMKSIVGVAGGATRASLTQHQAQRGNMADVSAKDGSQETLVNLIASFTGVFMLTVLCSEFSTWILFTILSSLHLFANYKAVRSLQIPILNEQRFNLLLQSYFVSKRKQVQSSSYINGKESVLLGMGLKDTHLCGFKIQMGVSLNETNLQISSLLKIVCSLNDEYIVLPNLNRGTISVIFNKQCVSPPVIKAYYHAVVLGIRIGQLGIKRTESAEINNSCSTEKSIVKAIFLASDAVAEHFAAFTESAIQKGWKMTRHHLLVDEWRAEWHFSDKKLK